jgi:hypothetical protein
MDRSTVQRFVLTAAPTFTAILLWCGTAAAQVQPNLLPGPPGIGVEEGLNSAGNLEAILVYQNGQQIQFLPVCTNAPVPRNPPLGVINTADFNFDGYPDIALEVAFDKDNTSFCIWLFNPNSKRFVLSPQLSQLTNPRPEPGSRSVISYTNQGCQGACHDKQTYVWSKGQLVLMKDEKVTRMINVDFDGPGCLYVLTLQERKKGRMIVKSRSTVNSLGVPCW